MGKLEDGKECCAMLSSENGMDMTLMSSQQLWSSTENQARQKS